MLSDIPADSIPSFAFCVPRMMGRSSWDAEDDLIRTMCMFGICKIQVGMWLLAHCENAALPVARLQRSFRGAGPPLTSLEI